MIFLKLPLLRRSHLRLRAELLQCCRPERSPCSAGHCWASPALTYSGHLPNRGLSRRTLLFRWLWLTRSLGLSERRALRVHPLSRPPLTASLLRSYSPPCCGRLQCVSAPFRQSRQRALLLHSLFLRYGSHGHA